MPAIAPMIAALALYTAGVLALTVAGVLLCRDLFRHESREHAAPAAPEI